jgi:GntR family transcriptional regulator
MDLEREGYIVSRRGRGTFIVDHNARNKEVELKLVENLTDVFLQKVFALGISSDDLLGIIEKRVNCDVGKEKGNVEEQ